MNHLVEQYLEQFGEIPFQPIHSNLSEEDFQQRIKRCLKAKTPLEELFPDDYDEPEGVLV